MHRILQLLIAHPDLLVDHATAYAELASADAQTFSDASQRTLLWTATLLCCISVAVILAAGGLMIWATVPEGTIRLPWILLGTPLLPTAAAIGCWKTLHPKVPHVAFAKVRGQMAADVLMLREVKAP